MADTGLIFARAAMYGLLLPAAGLPIYLATARRELSGAARAVIAVLAAGGIAASLWWALASVAAMAALPLSGLDRATVLAVLGATPLGMVLAVRVAALALLLLLLPIRAPARVLALPALVALATCAFAGHAGATEGSLGLLHRASDIVHLIAAACWIGALIALAGGALIGEPHTRLAPRLAAFARTGSVIVALLLATGIVNTLAIAGWPPVWAATWTVLLAAKLALVLAMLGLAGLNRWRFTPALAKGGAGARRHLRLSLTAETVLGFAVLAIVAALGVLDPAGLSG